MFKQAGKGLLTAAVGLLLSVSISANAVVVDFGLLSPGQYTFPPPASSYTPSGSYTLFPPGTDPSSVGTFVGGTVDDYNFSLLPGTYSISASVQYVTNVHMNLFSNSGTCPPSCNLGITGTGSDSGPHAGDPLYRSSIGPLTVAATLYALQIQGSPAGAGDRYSGNLNVNVAAVPEPEVWAMMLIGAGLIGYQVRRKARAGSLPVALG